jgi:hypothetical protein
MSNWRKATGASMTTRLKLHLLVVCGAVLAAVLFPSQVVTAKEDRAIAPKAYGWWSQTNIGGIVLAQPDVPQKGMLVENGPSGPIALSALRFSLKDGAAATRLELSISGTPVITQPPVACISTTAFESAQGGAWEGRPEYDCKQSVPGVVNAEQTLIRFVVETLAERRSLSVAILAGGPADRIAFAKPGSETLSLKTIATRSPSSSEPAESGSVDPSTVSDERNACCATGESTAPPVREREGQDRERNPGAAVPTSASQPDALPGPDAGGQGDSTRRAVGTTTGVTLLLLCILYWSDGFGALGLRSSHAARYEDVDLMDFRMHGQAWMTPAPVRPEDRKAAEGVSGQLNLPAVTGPSSQN